MLWKIGVDTHNFLNMPRTALTSGDALLPAGGPPADALVIGTALRDVSGIPLVQANAQYTRDASGNATVWNPDGSVLNTILTDAIVNGSTPLVAVRYHVVMDTIDGSSTRGIMETAIVNWRGEVVVPPQSLVDRADDGSVVFILPDKTYRKGRLDEINGMSNYTSDAPDGEPPADWTDATMTGDGGAGLSVNAMGTLPPRPPPAPAGESCGQFNVAFTIPVYNSLGVQVSEDDLKPAVDPNPPQIHPVTLCQMNCAAIADAKHQECKTKIKMFTEYMKTNGCPGTWCSTKKKSPCARRAHAKYRATRSTRSGCKTGYCGR